MANVTITQLPAAQPLTGTESVPVVQNGVTVQTTTGAIANAPVQTQTFLTVNNEPTLPNSRYFAEGLGIGLVDNGAQSYYRIALNGVSASLETATNGFIAKTGATVTPRALTVTGNGISVTNGDGQTGNPVIQLTGLANSIATQAGNGLIALNDSSAYTPVSIVGVTNQISVLNGNAAGANNPTIGLSNDPIVPGVAAITVPTGNTAQRPSGVAGQIRYNTDLNQFEGYSAGAWRVFSASGGISTFSAGTTGLLPNTPTGGTIVLSGVVNTSSGGTGVAGTLSGYVKGNGSSPMTSVAAIPTSDISGLGTMAIQNANSVAITGGSISGVALTLDSLDNTPIGVTTPSSGFFTGISATSGTINGDTIATLTASQILTNKTISGSSNTLTNIGNSSLTNSAVTINGTTVNLGGSITVTAASPNPLTIGTGLTGSSYNGVVPVTIAIDNTVATLTGTQTLTNKTISGSTNTLSNIGNSSLTNSSITINGTPVPLGGSVNTSGGTVTSITAGTGLTGGTITTSGTIAIDTTQVATLTATQTLTNKTMTSPTIATILNNSGTLTLPTTTDTLVGRATTDTLTNKSISGSTNTLTNIGNSSLVNSSVTVGGTPISLGGSGSFPLENLTDVSVSGIVSGQILGWNGSSWVNVSNTQTGSAGQGVSFWNATPLITGTSTNNTLPIISLATNPVTAGGTQTATSNPNGNTVAAIGLQSLPLGRTVLDAGQWTFDIYIGVNSTAGGSVTTFTRNTYQIIFSSASSITMTTSGVGTTRTVTSSAPFFSTAVGSAVNTTADYLETPQGLYQIVAKVTNSIVTIAVPATYANETAVSGSLWHNLFGVTSPAITNITPNYGLYTVQTTQPSFIINTTDALGGIGFTTSTANRVVTACYNGTQYASNVLTPLVTLHNGLGGLQGGAANEYYHLTTAEYTGTGTGNFVRSSGPTISNSTITGGTINNVTIGGTTPAAGTFTVVTATSGIYGGSF
jgi:trimeric autotransporter adhesin